MYTKIMYLKSLKNEEYFHKSNRKLYIVCDYMFCLSQNIWEYIFLYNNAIKHA